MGPLERSALVALAAIAPSVAACELPDDGAPRLRATVAAVKYQPKTEAWEKSLPAGTPAQYIVHLDQPHWFNQKCFWVLEVRAGNDVWKKFYVMPGGGSAFEDPPGAQAK